jgi:hypothetical protein|tara:strand:+ start:146 stop:1018 length:873 start_codon:yes stop_codon:yes gene_type:complete
MATSGEQTIRGLDIDKLAKGFADEENVFKAICTVSTTMARELRWYKKGTGFLDSVDTTGITASQIANTSSRSLPVVVEQNWTRQTSYIRKYFVESPLISMEDIKDTDIDILATNIRDLVRGVARQVDKRIYDVLSAGVGNTTAATATWDNGTQSNVNIIKDLLVAKRKIREQGYNPEGAFLLLTPNDHELMVTNLIFTKGSSIPAFSSEKMSSGVVMNILGLKVIVSTNVDADEAMVVVGQRALTWKSFMPITSVVMDEPGIGKKIRVWEEGECLVTDPSAMSAITNLNS